MRNCLLKTNFCLVFANDLGSFRCAMTGGEGVLVSGGWRRCWVQMWITKGPPHRSNPGITETPTVTSCKMGRCQDRLCFAKEWNWKLLLLGYFSFSQGKKSDCFILNECLRRQSRASISHSAEISDFSAPSPIAWGTRWKILHHSKKKDWK